MHRLAVRLYCRALKAIVVFNTVHQNMIHKVLRTEKGEFLLIATAIVLAGALSGLGSYLGGRSNARSSSPEVKSVYGQPVGNTAEQAPQAVAQEAKNVDPVTSADHIRGNPKAQVMLVEYSDPECPFCKQFHSTLKSIVEKYSSSGKVAWVYRNYPIDSLHPKARKEAEATECAAELGGNDGFWKFYDRLFEVSPTNNGLDASQLPVIAKYVGLDVEKFNACLSSGKYASKVQTSIDSGTKAGVSGTPTTFIVSGKSSKSIVGAVPASQLETEIQNALKN